MISGIRGCSFRTAGALVLALFLGGTAFAQTRSPDSDVQIKLKPIKGYKKPKPSNADRRVFYPIEPRAPIVLNDTVSKSSLDIERKPAQKSVVKTAPKPAQKPAQKAVAKPTPKIAQKPAPIKRPPLFTENHIRETAQVFANPVSLPVAPQSLQPPPRQILSGAQIFSEAGPSVFKLSTRTPSAQAAQSHGTAFVVHSDGYLITNYHVVADAALNSEGLSLVLQTDAGEKTASIIAIDAVNDLALIKVPQNFSKPLRLADESSLRQGEALVSLGFPKSEERSVVSGLFNGERRMGFSLVSTVSMPLNPGMSGGPTFNAYGEVIGVNRARLGDAQSISYLSPLKALRALVEQAGPGQRSPADVLPWPAQISAQVRRQENEGLSRGAQDFPFEQRLPGVSFRLGLAGMQCGQSSLENESASVKIPSLICRTEGLSVLSSDQEAMDVQFFAGESSRFKDPAAFKFVDQQFAKDKAAARAEKRKIAAKTTADTEKCGLKNVRNSSGVEVSVQFCSLRLSSFSDLHSTYIKIDLAPKKGRGIAIGQVYRGMSLPATATLVERFLESLQLEATP